MDNKKSGSGGIVVVVILVLLIAFVWFLPDINGLLSGNNNTSVEKNNKPTDKKDDTPTTKVTTCTNAASQEGLSVDATVKVYSTNNKLQKMDQEITYTSTSDDGKTSLELIKIILGAMDVQFNKYSGFNFTTSTGADKYTLSGTIDYSKVDKTEWVQQNDDGSTTSINIDYSYNQDITNIITGFVNQGYTCK